MPPAIKNPVHSCPTCGVKLKLCARCGLRRPIELFGKEGRLRSAPKTVCRLCHAARRRPTGPLPPRKRRPFAELFWSHVARGEANSCWEWNGFRDAGGYGKVRRYPDTKPVPASRASWEIHNGPIPGGLLVCHKCDNRACVNPAHLFLGTHKDNSQDMVRKGRHGRGGPMRKMTDALTAHALSLRDNGKSYRAIGREIGVSYHTVQRACAGNGRH